MDNNACTHDMWCHENQHSKKERKIKRKKPSGCDRVARVLSDGAWHTTRELSRQRVIVHSRIADLRRKGYKIEYRRTAGNDAGSHWYRIKPKGEE